MTRTVTYFINFDIDKIGEIQYTVIKDVLMWVYYAQKVVHFSLKIK